MCYLQKQSQGALSFSLPPSLFLFRSTHVCILSTCQALCATWWEKFFVLVKKLGTMTSHSQDLKGQTHTDNKDVGSCKKNGPWCNEVGVVPKVEILQRKP